MTKISVSYGVTKNLGNYESLRVDIGMERDLEPGESFDDAVKSAWQQVTRQVEFRSEKATLKAIAMKEGE